jgi:hypothetical protein
MHIPFNTLGPTAKTWIYQADRKLSASEIARVSDRLKEFTQQWLVHGAPLEASYEVRYDQFVILAANDSASGCSIDTSVRIMKEIGAETGIDFFNRNLVAFKYPEEIKLIDLALLKQAFQKGSWDEDTLVFNNAASTLSELNEHWLAPAGTTWLKRYIARPQNVQ